MFAISNSSTPGTTTSSSKNNNNGIATARQSRTSRACEGCRRRKIKCSGGSTCDSCTKLNEPCKYRQHYRALKGYPIKIISNPAERIKRRKSSTASSMSAVIGMLSISSPSKDIAGRSLPVDIGQISSQSSISSSSTVTIPESSSPSSYSSSTCSSYESPRFKTNLFAKSFSSSQQMSGGDSLDPKARLPSISNFQNILAPITPPLSTSSVFFANSGGNTGSSNFNTSSYFNNFNNKTNNDINNNGTNNYSISSNVNNNINTKTTNSPLHSQHSQISGSYSSYSFSSSPQVLPSIVKQNPMSARKQASTRMSTQKSTVVPTDLHLTEEQMLQCLSSYFKIYGPLFPMLNFDVWFRKAKAAWRSLVSRQVLSLNQIELAIVYTLVALGARECAPALFLNIPAADWAFEYYDRTKLIIPNVFEVPPCLSITQYMMLASMFMAPVDRAHSHTLANSAFRTATELGLHTLTDNTRYADIPALNASESHRTFVSAHLWSQIAALAAGSSSMELPAPVALNPRAFSDIGYYNTNILAHRIKMNEFMCALPTGKPPSVAEVDVALARALGDRSRYLRSTPPALVSSGIASQLNRSVSTREWLHYRLAYWATEVVQYRPFLIATVAAPTNPQWSAGAVKCLEAAGELYQLVAQPAVTQTALFDAWLFATFAELCLAVYLFRAVAGDTTCLALYRECAEFIGLPDYDSVLMGLRAGLSWREVARKLFGQEDGAGNSSPRSGTGSPVADGDNVWSSVVAVLR